MKCSECKWWDKDNAWGSKKDKASCRVNPPLLKSNSMACDTSGVWPSTYSSEWCKCFEEQINLSRKVGIEAAIF